MTTAVMKTNPALPPALAKLAALATKETMREMSGGVTSGFPIISYKGKVWRIRRSGEEQMHLDADGNAMPVIEVILVKANPNPSKNFFDKQYEEGSNEPPRCFSNDGIKPDPGIQHPIHNVCASCPNNAWGSRITPQGKKARACNDVRRMAVVFSHDLNEHGAEAQVMLLRVPPASLNPLKDYAEKVLAPKGIPFFSIATSIGFDVNAAHPQFVFKPKRFVNEEEAEAIIELRDSEDVRRILAEAIEFPAGTEQADTGAATPAAPQQAATGVVPPVQQAATQPVSAPAAKPAQKLRPASEEEAGLAATPAAKQASKPAVTAKPAAPPADEIAPAPASKKGTRKPAAAPAQVAQPVTTTEEEEEQQPPAQAAQRVSNGITAPPELDDLLDSLLNG